MRARILRALVFVALAAPCGCRRSDPGLAVVAPFNDETRIASVTATWNPIASSSPASDTLRFDVTVENRLADRLFVQLDRFTLLDAQGNSLAVAAVERACILPAGARQSVLSGTLTLPAGAAARVDRFDVNRFGVPLSERGRGIYREFLLQQEKQNAAEIDAEIGVYQQAEVCSP